MGQIGSLPGGDVLLYARAWRRAFAAGTLQKRILEDPDFIAVKLSTRFMERFMGPDKKTTV